MRNVAPPNTAAEINIRRTIRRMTLLSGKDVVAGFSPRFVFTRAKARDYELLSTASNDSHRAPGIGSFVGMGPVYRNTISPPPLPSVRYRRFVSGSCQISRVCRTLWGSLGPAPGGTSRGDRK